MKLFKRAFVVADIHGRLDELKMLLTKWNKDEEILIFLGDYFNRGEKGWEVIEYVKDLNDKYDNVVLLQGNHEEIFLDTIEHRYMLHSYLHGNIQAIKTLNNFKQMYNLDGSDEDMFDKLVEMKEEHISLIKEMKVYYLWSRFAFVHGGVDPLIEKMEFMLDSDIKNIRDEFIYNPHVLKKVVVFGHTPTQNILTEEVPDGNIWISKCRRKIGIDGGFDRLNAIVLSRTDETIINYYVKNNETVIKEKRYMRK